MCARACVRLIPLLLSEDEVDEALVYPNRALGGVLAIELSGCVIERDPHVDDEDDDPFMSDDYRCVQCCKRDVYI